MAARPHWVKAAAEGDGMTTSASGVLSTDSVLTIGGEAEQGAAGSYPVHNPARPAEVVGHAPAADRAQLDAAVSAARRAGARGGGRGGAPRGAAPAGARG